MTDVKAGLLAALADRYRSRGMPGSVVDS